MRNEHNDDTFKYNKQGLALWPLGIMLTNLFQQNQFYNFKHSSIHCVYKVFVFPVFRVLDRYDQVKVEG